MSGFVVDASVALKWVLDEDGADRAIALTRSHLLYAPDLIFTESANALWVISRRGDFTTRQAEEALQALRTAPLMRPCRDPDLMRAAFELARRLDHPVYDCVYLALAAELDRPVVTADRRFLRAVRAEPALTALIRDLDDAE